MDKEESLAIIQPKEKDSLSSTQTQRDKAEIQLEREKKLIKRAFGDIAFKDQELDDIRREFFRSLGSRGGKATARKHRQKFDKKFGILAKAFAALGLPEDNMAHLFEVHPTTFQRWKHAHPAFAMKIKEGQALRNTALLQGMMKNVRDGAYAVQIFLAKNWLGMSDKIDTTLKDDKGIFYTSRIPREKGVKDVDPTSIKKGGRK